MEQVEIEIVLEGIGYGERWPHILINVNNKTYFDGIVKGKEIVNFTAEIEEEFTNNSLEIIYDNHHYTDSITDDNGTVIKGKWITVDQIKLEGIDLGNLIYEKSKIYITEDWYTEQENKDEFPPIRYFETEISWNSKYVLEFNSPIYIWLLENL